MNRLTITPIGKLINRAKVIVRENGGQICIKGAKRGAFAGALSRPASTPAPSGLKSPATDRRTGLAARSGGFHFYDDQASGRWVCYSSDEQLGEMLARITLEQSGADLEFEEL